MELARHNRSREAGVDAGVSGNVQDPAPISAASELPAAATVPSAAVSPVSLAQPQTDKAETATQRARSPATEV